MRFRLIPAGSFMMGAGPGFSGQTDYELPYHQVTLSKPFYMAVTPVTQRQWQALAGSNPSSFKGDLDRPVDNVSYEDAVRWIGLLNDREGRENYRLPTEAEWEYAARAGSTGRYCFGDDEAALEQYAWYNADILKGGTQPVARKTPNAWGLYDVHGNVFEWTNDWFVENYYANSPKTDPKGPASGETRVTRGGSWGSDAWFCQTASRNSELPVQKSMFLGFRVVRNAR
jgi:formylglycine-generating enzyme required for sulfatase activity